MNDFAQRAAEEWHAIAILCLIAGVVIGWQLHRVFLHSRIETRPVYASDGTTIRGYRAYLGRLALGPLRQTQGEAENHAEHLREQP